MNDKHIYASINKLVDYIENENFKGYDPYDTLNSWIPFNWLGRWGEVLAIQFQKINPINIRPLIGVKKNTSTKGAGLLLLGMINLYRKTHNEHLLQQIENLKNWIISNQQVFQENYCWGYDYNYTTRGERVKKGFPTVVHHSYILKALFDYYIFVNKDDEILSLLKNGSKFILNSIPMQHHKEGISFGYNPKATNCCINASLHAAQCLAYEFYFTGEKKLFEIIVEAVNFVVAMQKGDGVWSYSFSFNDNEIIENERIQIDFHQGFVLESIYEIKKMINYTQESWEDAIKKGLIFYKNNQFYKNGSSLWRIPRVFPVDIHNQSQGIITFSLLKNYDTKYLDFAYTIANWTIENMQDVKGYFYYRKFKNYTNKISYMRWSQAWMLLALSSLVVERKSN